MTHDRSSDLKVNCHLTIKFQTIMGHENFSLASINIMATAYRNNIIKFQSSKLGSKNSKK